MRHGVKSNHLGRTASHRKSMLSNMASSLIKHKKITTTVAKAKALRVYVEPLLTKAKSDSVHNRRTVFSYLRDKEAIKELYGVIASKIGDRQGGYTRILKLGNRMGDNAEMALIELVDFNEFIQPKPAKEKKKSTRRGRSSGQSKKAETVVNKVETSEEPKVEDAAAEIETVEEVKSEEIVDNKESADEATAEDSAEENKEEK
ncbi:MAG: 50S ribosomal protein L17 [Bacteroidetes bacterium]|nr:50S ribosomal protein L17 [Bacteroidota bacterium]